MAQAGAVGAGQPAPGQAADGIAQVSSMPLPPMQFILEYTDEAVRRGSAPPPPPPISDSYTMFGQPFSSEDCIVASLESQGIRRLYSAKEVDRKRELRKLNHSVLVNFLDLLDILIKTPDSAKREEKIEDLNLLFIHMHHLINEFRPHQARETLRVMLHVQKRKRSQVTEKFREHLDMVQEMIQVALDALPELEDIDSKSGSIKGGNEDLQNGDSGSQMSGPAKLGCSPIDTALCLVADDMFMSLD